MKRETKEELIKTATELGNSLFNIRSAFLVWRQLEISRDSTITDKEYAEQSLEIINWHKGFFVPAITSLQHYFNVELYTLTTKMNEKSIPGFLKELEVNGFNYTDKYQYFLDEHKGQITKIGKCRNKLLAHKDRNINPASVKLPSIVEYENLFKDLEKVFNKATSESLGHGFWFFEDESLEAYRDTNLLMENLLRGEASRKANIEAEHREKLREYFDKRKKD